MNSLRAFRAAKRSRISGAKLAAGPLDHCGKRTTGRGPRHGGPNTDRDLGIMSRTRGPVENSGASPETAAGPPERQCLSLATRPTVQVPRAVGQERNFMADPLKTARSAPWKGHGRRPRIGGPSGSAIGTRLAAKSPPRDQRKTRMSTRCLSLRVAATTPAARIACDQCDGGALSDFAAGTAQSEAVAITKSGSFAVRRQALRNGRISLAKPGLDFAASLVPASRLAGFPCREVAGLQVAAGPTPCFHARTAEGAGRPDVGLRPLGKTSPGSPSAGAANRTATTFNLSRGVQ